ncbi:MAG: LuxR C-terminal-related transcriptional regulator [Actinomycetes bacterium]
MIGALADTRARLESLAGRPLEAAEFSREVSEALQRTLTFDGWCLIGFDPHTGLRTVQFGGRGTEHTAEMARNEALMSDVNRYEELAVASVPVGCLSPDHPQARHSFRLHEVLLPQGFHSELRLALRDGGRLWGALVLLREDPRRLFDDHDTAALCDIAGPLTSALRAYPVRPLPRRGSVPGAGVVALAPDDRLVELSAEAQQWLDDLVPGGDDQTWASDVTRVLFDAAHAVRRGDVRRASSCVRTVSGHWLRVEGTALSLGQADVAVVLRPAAVDDLLGTLAAYSGLTRRESDVLTCLAHGLPGKHIARELAISPLTVNGHLRSLYRKCGVTGREELVGRLT